MQKATIPVKGLKINTLVPPAALPADLVPPEPQPAEDVIGRSSTACLAASILMRWVAVRGVIR
jgi:hypothetical protein